MKDIAMVYMVAGISSRFDGKIKQLAKIGPNEETLIEYSLNQALPAGFTKIIFIIGNKTKEPFKNMFGDNYGGIPIYYAFQEHDAESRDKPWGTVDALCTIKSIIGCPFVVCNGDDLYGEEAFKILVNHLKANSTSATIGYKLDEVLPKEGSVNRGILQLDLDNTVKSIKEEFDLTKNNLESKGLSEEDLCSMNIFALQTDILDELKIILDNFKQEHRGDRKIECLLPEKISKLVESGKITMKIYQTDEKWLGVTNPEDEFVVKEMLKKA